MTLRALDLCTMTPRHRRYSDRTVRETGGEEIIYEGFLRRAARIVVAVKKNEYKQLLHGKAHCQD